MRILDLLDQRGVVSVRELVSQFPEVSAVTIRRDLVRLEREGKLRRTRGGAVRISAATQGEAGKDKPGAQEHDSFDVLVLPPVKGEWAHTLRQQAIRRGTLLIAESAPQLGGVYLGPRNRDASRELGRLAARQQAEAGLERAEVLLVALEGQQNTRERLDGFREGFEAEFPGKLLFHRVDGRGLLKEAVRQTVIAFEAHPTINIVFGVNDHTILGALEVAERLGIDVAGYSVGGEGGVFFDKLVPGGQLKAVLALFPEVVGRAAVDVACAYLDGGEIASEVITPAKILTAENIGKFYHKQDGHWRILPSALEAMAAPFAYQGRGAKGRSIGFILQYPSHEWYRGLAAAMRQRALEVGAELVTRNAEDEVAEELRLIKRRIGEGAAEVVNPGDVLLIDGGESSRYFAEALRRRGCPVNVYTNSLDVLEILSGAPGVSVFLTGGEYRPSTRTLVGPSVGTLLETIRVDAAVISPDGVAPNFGISFEDERSALVCKRFCSTARQVIVLADHGAIALESSVQACRLAANQFIFTDAGALSAHCLELSAAGPQVFVVDQDDDFETGLRRDSRQTASPNQGR